MKKYLYLIKTSFINTLDYRQELVTNFVISILIFASMAIFWRAVFVDHDELKGFNFTGIIQYYIFLSILLDIVDTQFAFKFIKEILNGHVTNLLLKPVNIKQWLFVRELGQILPLLLIKLVVFGIFFEIFIGHFEIQVINLLGALLVLPISFAINANIYFILGCIAFWLGEIKGLLYGIRRVIMFISGGLIPMVFFPDMLQNIVTYLPFKYVFQFPLEIFTEGVSVDKLPNLIVMLVWLVVLSILSNRFLKYSYKRNESVGI